MRLSITVMVTSSASSRPSRACSILKVTGLDGSMVRSLSVFLGSMIAEFDKASKNGRLLAGVRRRASPLLEKGRREVGKHWCLREETRWVGVLGGDVLDYLVLPSMWSQDDLLLIVEYAKDIVLRCVRGEHNPRTVTPDAALSEPASFFDG